ncbi:FAD-dependent monooxygenase [Pontivivens ytuae]|uniref:FAD-dependent monooxygenase n=1 Tax=Pontivivens ytuae TaxID=2789856 RepID=A0A7S9LQP5_9RHOB|nr:FAD-dependent monooxygenase [Pontivivens ytuae]QPH53534.1 FAD-dependent monooxygenase [Pontivivens ytuae]
MDQIDVIVAGGGVAGLMAAMAFAHRGQSVLCVDPVPPVTERDAEGSDLRSTAFLMPAVEMMREVGLWDRLAPEAAELAVMRLCDSGGEINEIRESADFVATEIGQDLFGWNVPNYVLRREMTAHAEAMEGLELRLGTGVANVLPRTGHALVSLDDGSRWRCDLLVGADGRNSLVREALGIDVRTVRYGQKAVVFAVGHDLPHQGISTELHRTGGPFTLVPLPDDPEGGHRSAVVWMETGPKAAALMEMDAETFAAEATARSCHVLGPLTLESPRRVWPIVSQEAQELTGPHTALIAEAAHVMPPIGAQGLNTSFADIRALIEAAGRHALGSDEMLEDYAKARRADIALRERGVELLNRAAMTDVQALRDLRRQGLRVLAGLGPVKQVAMRTGMGL